MPEASGSMTAIETPCIEWPASRNRDGYGRADIHTRICRKARRAHRVAWEEANGPIPDEMLVCHRCDNPPCVNVDHLYLGTHADNARDRVARGRQHDNAGDRCPAAKLTSDQVRSIRAEYVPRHPEHGGAAMGRRYGVSTNTITDAVRGDHWASVR